jgi:ferredoxin
MLDSNINMALMLISFIRSLFMAYKITDECTSCGACESECPVEAISQGASQYEIDADTCTSCGLCAGVCPVEAIVEG